ncbi:PD-(D/E)XK nuclease family protein [Francisella philomiragia]|uniref:PD-(D/E)XK nuclease superfamily protein n=1 Tax=Francisella philomiragia TaxID=28110 RepID=A0A0B6CQL1_9GAMM|nr:PD-(D/E)XK nuclease family protein [Francisella philomiragia]AJI52759.1 PD-(D/E)XK nuclease superfamily protein [Francisella philomiragia]
MGNIESNWIEKLKESPIFNMSLSSKELFHSNFIAWILETYPEEMAEFFSKSLGVTITNSSEITEVQREKQNIDISFKLGDTLFLIENKVKSIANIEQLQKYTDKFEKVENKKLVLLSLKDSKISDDDIEEMGWKKLSYEKLLEAFQSLEFKKEYHKSLIVDYVKFVTAIKNNIINKIDIENVQISNLYDKNKECFKYLEFLKKIKMHDIFLKGLYEDFARAIYDELSKLDKLKNKVEYTSKPNNDKNIFVSHDFTDGKGLVDIKYKIDKYFFIGIQIQGDEYRHFVVLYNDKTRHIESILRELKGIWFEFKEIGKRATYPVRKGLEYRSYTTKNYIFKHKSFKIDDMENAEVINRVKEDIEYLVENCEGIKNIYN